MIKLLIFDLDNTLSSEHEYVLSGFRAVADYVSNKRNLSKEEIFNSLCESFLGNGRGRNFDELKEKFPLDDISIEELVRVYRGHLPELKLYPEAEPVLRSLSKKYKLTILTNGAVEVQKRKVQALQLEQYFDKFFFAQENGKEFEKPHKKVFKDVLTSFEVEAHEALMIGDDIVCDIGGAKEAGINSILIREPRDLFLIERYLEKK